MAGDRLLRILAHIEDSTAADRSPSWLCRVCTEVTEVTGAGIMLMSGDVARGSVCTSDEVSALIEDLQYMLGEGPCVDAYRHDRPVLEPNLADPAVSRWLAFAPPALDAGARAVFGFPLRVGAIRIGALNLYRDRPGPLDAEQHADALVLAGVAARSVLAMQAAAPPGRVSAELRAGSDLHLVVHQASGMLSVQRGVSVAEALIRLRAYAFAHDRPLRDVARDVVGRTLRIS